jgi:hypothetical protein
MIETACRHADRIPRILRPPRRPIDGSIRQRQRCQVNPRARLADKRRSSQFPLTLESFLRLGGSGDLVHLCCDLVEEGKTIFPDDIDIEVRSSWKKCEVLLSPKPVQDRLESVRSTIQIQRVVGADNQMNLAAKVGANGVLVAAQVFDDVVMRAPVGSNAGIDRSCDPVEKGLRAAIRSARREYPLK